MLIAHELMFSILASTWWIHLLLHARKDDVVAVNLTCCARGQLVVLS